MMSAAAVRAADGLKEGLDGVQDWDLLLRVVEQVADASVVHVPRVLYHWREGKGSIASGVYQKEGITTAQRTVIGAMLARRQTAADVACGLWKRATAMCGRPTPRQLYHHESASRGYDNSPMQRLKADEEEARFRSRWELLVTADPNYNVNLAADGQLFSQAFPPRLDGCILSVT